MKTIDITEKVNDQYLYHNTSLNATMSIIKLGAIGHGDDYNPMIGYQSLSPGYVSFSRSKKYRSAPGAGRAEVRFVFDYQALKRKYRIEPFADGMVVNGDKFLKGGERRWESEEIVWGPVQIKDGLVRIELLATEAKKIEEIIVNTGAAIVRTTQKIKRLDTGDFWHPIRKEWIPITTIQQRKFHSLENYQKSIDSDHELIYKYQKLLSHPKVQVVDNFN